MPDGTQGLSATHHMRSSVPGQAGTAAISRLGGEASSCGSDGDAPECIATLKLPGQWDGWSLGQHADGSPTCERFAIGQLLGAGSSGTVFAAHDRGLERSIALKLLNDPHLDDADAVAAILAEARMTASLQHPNVLPVYDLGRTTDGRPYFSMHRNQAGTLGDAITASTLKVRDPRIASANGIVTIFIALCQVTSYAHHQGVIHQDIKPENVCLGTFGEVLLLDWGSAVRLDDQQTTSGKVYGTPLYMSPEQARGEPPAASCDIYCLGATFYHALTLCLPTWSDDPAAFWAKKRAGVLDEIPAAHLAGCPPALLGIARKALAATPAERYASADDLRRDLLNYQAGLAVSAYREGIWQHWRRWYRFHRGVFWISAIAVAVISLVTAAWLAEKARERSSWRVMTVPALDAQHGAADGAWSITTWAWQDPQPTAHALDDRAVLERGADYFVLQAGAGTSDLLLDTGRLGDVRVEWDYTPLDRPYNLNCYLGADRKSGFTFHIGGWNDSRKAVVTWRDNEHQLAGHLLDEPLRVGVTRHFTMEREAHHVRLRIDGRLIFDVLDPADRPNMRSGRFGFDTCDQNRVRIAHLVVSSRPMAERISPLAVGDRLAESGHDAEALAVYHEIASSYPGTALADEANYRSAICTMHLGHHAEGLAQLHAIEVAAPSSSLAAFAIHEQLTAAWMAGDQAQAADLLTRLCAHPGHPLLPLAVAELAERYREELLTRRVPAWVGDPVFPADLPARIEAARADLIRWAKRMGQEQLPDSFTRAVTERLRACDRNDLILGHGPEDRDTYARALVESGRFQEVLDNFRDQEAMYGEALLATRQTAMLRDGRHGADLALRAAADDGQFDESAASFRGGPALGGMLIRAGRADQALRDSSADPGIRCQALLALGRIDEAEKSAEGAFLSARVLLARGRLDEILTKYPDQTNILYQIALRWMLAGETDKARILRDRLATHFFEATGSQPHWATTFLAAFVARTAGRAQEAESLLNGMLAQHRYMSAQCPWYAAAYIGGRIDAATFKAQPCQRQCGERFLFAQGLRHLWQQDIAAAGTCFRQVADLPWWRLDLEDDDRLFLNWCLRMTAR